jgi:hypothetical protein
MDFNVGDIVRITRCPAEGTWTSNHVEYEGKTGVVKKVDTDGTASVDVEGDAHWFRLEGLIRERAAPVPCSCGGPETIVHILFQPVRVCKKCKREKP